MKTNLRKYRSEKRYLSQQKLTDMVKVSCQIIVLLERVDFMLLKNLNDVNNLTNYNIKKGEHMFYLKSLFVFSILAILVLSSAGDSFSQSKIRIGTYDSRMVAVAFYNSKYFNMREDAKKRMDVAREKNDTVEINNIMKEMPLRQRFMHEQAFGKGSVSWIMDAFKEKISGVAEKEKVGIVVSKFELLCYTKDTELIDITLKLCDIFESSVDLKQMYTEMQAVEPIKDAFLIED